jgi:hypothetical protein
MRDGRDRFQALRPEALGTAFCKLNQIRALHMGMPREVASRQMARQWPRERWPTGCVEFFWLERRLTVRTARLRGWLSLCGSFPARNHPEPR